MPINLETIEDCSFEKCSSLEEITIPSKVALIASSSFFQCSKLKKVHFLNPNSINTIKPFAFYECPLLDEIKLPSSVNIENNAFPKPKKKLGLFKW